MTIANKKKKNNSSGKAKLKSIITITDLEIGMCKWPMGIPSEPDFTFCGGKTNQNAPYCLTHAQMAYHVLYNKKAKKKPFSRSDFILSKKEIPVLEPVDDE